MTMSSGSSTATPKEAEEWTPESEIQLFMALDGLKPVGINKYFYMACISERLSKALNRDITTDAIWTHLKTMYNLAALDEMEPLPFPNTEREFALPEAEFSGLLRDRKEKELEPIKEEDSQNRDRESKADKGQSHSKERESRDHSNTPATTPGAPASASQSSSQSSTGHEEKRSSSTSSSSSSRNQNSSSSSSAAAARPPKRTRGSMSLESNSPSTTPPPVLPASTKRRRI